MKYLIGMLVVLFLLGSFAYVLARIWGVDLIGSENVHRSLATGGLVLVVSIILTILIPFFFRKNNKGYNTASGNRAHPKI